MVQIAYIEQIDLSKSKPKKILAGAINLSADYNQYWISQKYSALLENSSPIVLSYEISDNLPLDYMCFVLEITRKMGNN